MSNTLSKYFKEFTSSEKNAGIVLLGCAILSLILANTSFSTEYIHFWHIKKGFSFLDFDLHLSIEHWINDGIMTIFFLMVGLEIERELYNGELNPIKNAILPIGGAIGGMLVPALLFAVINYNTNTSNGFGIPMGTDIAFALAVIALAGNRVPVSIKIILTAIAIIDDLGSILIIAFFYGSNTNYTYLLIALGIFGILLLLNRLKVHSFIPYILLGILMWFFMMQSGIHPTISGVLLAFAYPFGDGSEKSPSIQLQHRLHLPVAYIILPLFTLANTAIPVKPEFVNGLTGNHAIGIFLGLFIGKPLGIILVMFALTKSKIVALPKGISWYDILGMGCIAGIGFTMSIFITQLAFSEELYIQSSKMMILIVSCVAGITGFILFSIKRRFIKQTNI
ncbi:MAG: Na+/H+ antiporter NhaA [Bacteroidota bacterium]